MLLAAAETSCVMLQTLRHGVSAEAEIEPAGSKRVEPGPTQVAWRRSGRALRRDARRTRAALARHESSAMELAAPHSSEHFPRRSNMQVLMINADDFEDTELLLPLYRLREARVDGRYRVARARPNQGKRIRGAGDARRR